MKVRVEVVLDPRSQARAPEDGVKLRIELRDTSEADAPAKTVARWDGRVHRANGNTIGTAVLEFDEASVDARARITVWVRVAASGAPRTAKGDWIVMESIVVPLDKTTIEPRIQVPVRCVG